MQIVIIGASAAGISAATEIRKKDADALIQVVSAEPHLFYHRPSLSEYIGDTEVAKKSHFHPNKADWFAINRIDLILNDQVVKINPEQKNLELSSGRILVYDKLIIATGSKAFVPIKDALQYKNVFTLRSLDDARSVYEYSKKCKKITVIGGGLLGLEAANSLVKQNLEVSILEINPQILQTHLDTQGAEILKTIITNLGIKLYLDNQISEMRSSDSNIVENLLLTNGEIIDTDMVIFAIGARPNLEIAAGTNIQCGRGIIVNEKMETNLSDIYAAGDTVQFGQNHCLWMPAIKQGKTAGLNALGGNEIFVDENYPVMLNSFGTKLFSIGNVNKNQPADYLTVQRFDPAEHKYQKLFFIDNVLCGAIIIGDTKKAMSFTKAVNLKMPLKEVIDLFAKI